MHSLGYSKFLRKLNLNTISQICSGYTTSTCPATSQSGLVIGVYDVEGGCQTQELSDAGERLNEQTNGLLKELLKRKYIPLGQAEVYSGLGIGGFTHLALTSLGPKNPNKLNYTEQLNEEKENIRVGIGVGARLVQDAGAGKIAVDGATVPESAAEGAMLATYEYKANISLGDKTNPVIELYDHPDTNSWASGEINAESQNWARYLSHCPPNLKKPTLFANEIMEKLCKFDIRIDLRNREFMTVKKMSATLALTKSSCEPPILVELGYCGDDPEVRPVVLVGKGNIFDSGGLFMKPYKGLHDFRADMAGAASIVATMLAIARKRLPINVRAIILLYEMMPSPMGVKPGDVVRDRNGTYIRIANPDNDCRVVLSDILGFSDYYSPQLIIDVGTFTKSAAHAFGLAASAAFTSTTPLWHEMQRAGLESGDRFWRMPFWKYFANLNTEYRSCDLNNDSSPSGGDVCQAAAFIKNFLPLEANCCCPPQMPYVHIDMFNTGLLSQTSEEIEPYYRKGIKMGRPTRGLIQFLYHRACLLPKAQQVSNLKKKPCI